MSTEPTARRPLRSSRLRVGVDIVGVSEVAQSLDRFGARYVRRVFTDAEAEYCAAVTGRAAAARFAARFAAKEATFKALRPEEPPVDWRSIEVRRGQHGWCDIVLHGEMAGLAERTHVASLTLSMTHEADYAAAVVVAELSAADNQELP